MDNSSKKEMQSNTKPLLLDTESGSLVQSIEPGLPGHHRKEATVKGDRASNAVGPFSFSPSSPVALKVRGYYITCGERAQGVALVFISR